MVRDIVKDEEFLSEISTETTKEDLPLAVDLVDTLTAHKKECVGMAANMIGVKKRVIIFDDNGKYTVMFNPVILSAEKEYLTEEGCLSLVGTRQTKRYRRIRVIYKDERFQTHSKSFTDRTAQIIQHEMDHLNGILI